MYAFDRHLVLLVAFLLGHVTAISIHVQAEDTADKRSVETAGHVVRLYGLL